MSSKATIQMRPGAGPHQLHRKKAEKIKDIKGTIKRLLGYLIKKKFNIFIALQKLPLKYFDNNSSGDLMSRLTNDVDNINTTLSQSVTQLFSGIINIIGINTIQGALAGAERVFEVIDEEKEKDKDDAVNIDNIEGHVELRGVTFSYSNGKEILKNVSLEAKKGEVIAIVGPTGAGKTTIVNLLTKFYEIDSGDILIDGKNINEITRESLRKTVAMVLQDTYLFSETVSENIRYGRLDASDEEVIEAAKMADAHHFIKQLPQGYDTVLSDNGGNLSQGQRQLLAIARAILSNASILILDEATSSIDTRTEVLIQNAMLKLMEGKSTFVIAHRLSTIRNADKILALKGGEIIESGTHDELLAKEGFYANLYNSQFKNGAEI